MKHLNFGVWVYACLTSWFEDILVNYPVTTGFVIGLVIGATVL